MSQIKAGTTSTTAIVETGDITGNLELFGNAGTGITVDATTGKATMPEMSVSGKRVNTVSSGGVVRKAIRVTGIADNVATALFTVTTPNGGGTADGGVYTCNISATIGHPGSSGATSQAVKKWSGSFSRAMIASGSGASTALENVFSGTSVATAPATRDISTVTFTTAETTEYIITVSVQIDLTGASVANAIVVADIELIYSGFSSEPVIA
jgi:hypothetical protein